MDLGTIRQKLLANEYQSMGSWREEVDLVWANALTLNSKTSAIGAITIELQSLFRKLTQHFTDNPEGDWFAVLNSLQDELNGISRSAAKREASKRSGGRSVWKSQSTSRNQEPPRKVVPPPLP
jgi:hypothetical protein